MSALDHLQTAKAKADARADFRQFMASRPSAGWTVDDIEAYRQSIEILMGDDDLAALSLFPPGTYQTAEIARDDARQYWRTAA